MPNIDGSHATVPNDDVLNAISSVIISECRLGCSVENTVFIPEEMPALRKRFLTSLASPSC